MNIWRQKLVPATLAVVVLGVTTLSARAQGVQEGTFTDKWGNPIAGAQVIIEPAEGSSGSRQETTTGEDGQFQFVGLVGGSWEIEVHANGYQPIRTAVNVRQLSGNRPVEIELDVLPSGGRFRGNTEFEAEGGVPRVRFNEDGEFEFQDADGEGEGTYGIVELSAVLTVRDYDGPDDKYSVSRPVTLTFPTDQFLSATWGETRLNKR